MIRERERAPVGKEKRESERARWTEKGREYIRSSRETENGAKKNWKI